MAGQDKGRSAAEGTPITERIVGALGALLLLGVCGVLGWEIYRGEGEGPSFTIQVIATMPSNGGHLVRFRVANTGQAPAERVTVRGDLAAAPPETARLLFDFLAAGEEREGGLLFRADPGAHPLTLNAESFSDP